MRPKLASRKIVSAPTYKYKDAALAQPVHICRHFFKNLQNPHKIGFLGKKTFDLKHRNKGLACPNKGLAAQTYVPERPITHLAGVMKGFVGEPFGHSAAMDESLAQQRDLQARGNGAELGHEDFADDFGDVSAFGCGG